MRLTDRLGQQADVDVASVEPEIHNLLHAADAVCGISSTAAEVENLRRARSRLMDAIDRAKTASP